MNVQLRRLTLTHKWWLFACILFLGFLFYTYLFATDTLFLPTVSLEHWWLQRPVSLVDCTFHEWRTVGEVPYMLVLLLLVGGCCFFLRYRKRILLYLLVLFFLGVACETLGKQLFPEPFPEDMGRAFYTLSCPQIDAKPLSTRLFVMAGIWWKAPTLSPKRQRYLRTVADSPLNLDDMSDRNGYPSGHALRWSFLGLVSAWLIRRHISRRPLRVLLLIPPLVLAFLGGFAQFYIGAHLLPDIISGDLLGAGLACCAIALLLRNELGAHPVRIHQLRHAPNTLEAAENAVGNPAAPA